MTVHLKPLFNRRILEEAIRTQAPVPSDAARDSAKQWALAVRSGALQGQTEKNLQGSFLGRVLESVLGYAQVAGGSTTYFMKPEHALKAVKSGRTPDACLGFFDQHSEHVRAVVELKAPHVDLDAKQGGNYGNLTPIEQAFGYASKLDGCRWVIVSNFVTLRLYRYVSGQGTCHEFDLGTIGDDQALRTFLFLLGCDTLLGSRLTRGAVDELAEKTHVQDERITKHFYAFYKSIRLDLFQQLARDNPAPAGGDSAEHEVKLLEHAQKILDRVLFICFCEDTGLLPVDVIRMALSAVDAGFVKVSRWQQLVGLFQAVDQGHPPLRINGYNGGLFARDVELEALLVSDEQLDHLLKLSQYDFETDLNVNILGHIFEQSISDLEAIRAAIRGEPLNEGTSKRKKHGIFYTPDFITRFIVRRTIGSWLEDRFDALQTEHRGPPGTRMSKKTEAAMWLAYLDVLKEIKVVDPACGSGAFLVAAFDFLHGEYQRVNRNFAEVTGGAQQLGLFDLNRQILQHNLFGVDLNPESVEITKLSLWLKTASRDRPLNNLDGNIRCGNSLVNPAGDDDVERSLHRILGADVRPFDWERSFPQVFARGGFDVVLGNPPYVRQETIAPIKPLLERHYSSYHGAADLFVYFYERGLNLLAEAGKLSYIVSNKWFRAGYGEPLRRLLSEKAIVEEIIDFGHAPIFEDADTFPCIVVYRRKTRADEDEQRAPSVKVCAVPRDREKELSLEQFVDEHAYPVPWSRYGSDVWSLESPEVDGLMRKLQRNAISMREFAGVKPLYGIKTGLNEAFLITEEARLRLIATSPDCEVVLRPYLRGRDIKRWSPAWQNLWMIALKSSGDWKWPWSDRGDDAERIFAQTYPALHAHLKPYEEALRKRSDKGRFWWELRSCDYYARLDQPKIVHTDIAWYPQFAFTEQPTYVLNTCYFWPVDDKYLLAVLNSAVMWSYLWRHAQHGKDEALRLFSGFMETLPIARPSDAIRGVVEVAVGQLRESARAEAEDLSNLGTWLHHEFGVDATATGLDVALLGGADGFVDHVRGGRAKGAARLTPAALGEIVQTHERYAQPARSRRAGSREFERRIAQQVAQAYQLTEAEQALLRKTAPPRSPFFET